MKQQFRKTSGPYILAAGAAIQVLTGIPAAWGVFQQPVMQEYGLSRRGRLCWLCGADCGLRCGLRDGRLLQDAHGPRLPGCGAQRCCAAGFFAAAHAAGRQRGAVFLVFSIPAGLGTAFLAPAVLACAQKWYTGSKGWPPAWRGAMGLSGAFFTAVRAHGVSGLWAVQGIRGASGRWEPSPCRSALRAALILQTRRRKRSRENGNP